MKQFGDGRDWFFEKRFGMFIHWGLYAIPAWHEQDSGAVVGLAPSIRNWPTSGIRSISTRTRGWIWRKRRGWNISASPPSITTVSASGIPSRPGSTRYRRPTAKTFLRNWRTPAIGVVSRCASTTPAWTGTIPTIRIKDATTNSPARNRETNPTTTAIWSLSERR